MMGRTLIYATSQVQADVVVPEVNLRLELLMSSRTFSRLWDVVKSESEMNF